jgi:hypothetical protein
MVHSAVDIREAGREGGAEGEFVWFGWPKQLHEFKLQMWRERRFVFDRTKESPGCRIQSFSDLPQHSPVQVVPTYGLFRTILISACQAGVRFQRPVLGIEEEEIFPIVVVRLEQNSPVHPTPLGPVALRTGGEQVAPFKRQVGGASLVVVVLYFDAASQFGFTISALRMGERRE